MFVQTIPDVNIFDKANIYGYRTYPTPFLDYGTAYTILGNWSASSTCIREGFTSLVPSSHPIFSQPTIAPAPVSSPGSVYSLTSISLSPSSSIEVRAVVDPTSAFYCSAFSDQGPLHICSSTSLSSFATSASSAAPSPSPITHTTVAFLTQTQAPKSLDAAAFAALIASVERGEKSKKPPQASSSRINAESEVVGKGSTAGQGPYSTAGVPKQSATNDIPGSVTSTPPSVTVQNTHTANSDPETENSEDPLHSNGGGTVPRIRSSTAWPVYVAGSHSLTMTTTEIGATIPATGDSGPQIDPTTPIPAVIIGGQTLTALDPSAAVTINGATAHLTIVSAGGMTKTGVVFSSPGAKPSTVVIPAQGAGESNTAGGSGGETVSLNCRGLGGCSSASGTATETGTATGQNVQQFTAGAARDVGSREIYTVVVVLISVLFVNG